MPFSRDSQVTRRSCPTRKVPVRRIAAREALQESREAIGPRLIRLTSARMRRSRHYGDVRWLRIAAGVSIINGQGQNALVDLLRVVTLGPHDPSGFDDFAAVLLNETFVDPNVVLGLLDEADRYRRPPRGPAGISRRALALNTRGLALIRMGQFKTARGVLQAAVRAAPDLAEARSNLSAAKLCAAPYSLARRFKDTGVKRSASAPTPRIGGGQPGKLPRVAIPVSAAKWSAARERGVFTAAEAEFRAQADRLGGQAARQWDAGMAQIKKMRQPGRRLTEQFVNYIDSQQPPPDPALPSFYALGKQVTDLTGETVSRAVAARGGSDSCAEWRVYAEGTPAIGAAMAQLHGVSDQMYAWSSKWASAKADQYSIAALRDAELTRSAEWAAKVLADGHVRDLTEYAYNLPFPPEDCTNRQDPDPITPEDVLGARPPAQGCNGAFAAKVEIAVVSVKVNCEIYEIEASTPSWLGPKLKISSLRGETTVFMGAKVGGKIEVGGVGGAAEADAGVYVRVNSNGGVDVGVRAGVEGKVEAGPAEITITEGNAEVSFAGAFEWN